MVAFAAERGLLVISDETYERFVYDAPPASAAALAAEFPETVVLVGSFSKTYAMTGWRIGYLLGPPPVVQAVENIQSHATSNPTSFAMVGALAALRHAEPDVEVMVAEYQARREIVAAGLNAIPGFRLPPAGRRLLRLSRVSACFRPGRADSSALAEYLLEEAGGRRGAGGRLRRRRPHPPLLRLLPRHPDRRAGADRRGARPALRPSIANSHLLTLGRNP